MAQTTLERRPYTNSELFSGYYLDERLRALRLPDVDAVSDGLENYRHTKERAGTRQSTKSSTTCTDLLTRKSR